MHQWVKFSAKVAAGILSAWFLLLPVTVNALGFGNIKMNSGLNEPLNAEIELLSATSDDIKGLEVKLASREAFLRAGVDRSVLLSQIKFDITKRGSKYYVTLNTQQTIREPFLNFLLELNWKNGRMLREYTVLLDPADRVQRQRVAQAPETTPPAAMPEPEAAAAPEPIAAPEPVPAPASPFMEAPAPAPEPAQATQEPLFPAVPLDQAPQVPAAAEAPTPAPEPAPVAAEAPAPEPIPAPEAVAAAPAMPEPAPVPAPEAVMPAPEAVAAAPAEPVFEGQDDGGLFPQIPLRAYSEAAQEAPVPAGEATVSAAPEPAYEPVGELDYGITKKGDSLWRIAEKLKPNEQVTVYQVMLALQQSNPGAFVDGNIHRMKVGQVMRIEDPSLLTAMSKEQAAQQYQAQTQAWEGYLASVGGQVPRQAIIAGEQAETARGSGGVPSGELTLATPQAEEMAAGAGGGDATASGTDATLLQQQVRTAMQEASTERRKNAELSARLSDLEAELKRMENLVTIKDSDLANLQRKLDQLNAQRAVTGAPEPVPAPTRPEPATTVEPPPVEPAPAEVATAPQEAIAPPPVEPVTAPEPEVSTAPAEPAVPAPPPVVEPAPAPVPQPVTMPAKDGGFMGMLKRTFGGLSSMMMIIGGAVLLVVILLVFIIVRRRKGVNFQESILTGGNAAPDSVMADATPSQGSSLMGGESSFLSDFAISGVSAIQAEDSEVDPLTEADVFMAYGRYEAAEERLQEAITQDPKRGELRVKLLELFNTTKNKKAFESTAEDYYAALGGNVAGNPLWQKVVAMGRELVPSNPLFSGGVASNVKAEPHISTSNLNEKDVMDIGLDTGVFNTSDFSTEAFTEKPKSKPAAPDSGLDFNLDMGKPAGKAKGKESDLDFSLSEAPGKSAAADEGLDFNLDTDSELGGGLDFNLEADEEDTAQTPLGADDGLDFSLNLEGDEEPTATDIKLGMDDEQSAADLDFDFANEPATTPAGTDMNLDASDAINLDMAGGSDEVGTKLDLARAYIDMGDPDGARSILDEVMDEGNDGQKKEAQQLMSQIG